MNKKVNTIKIGQFNYAKVSSRLKEFHESNPRGSIETKPTIQEDGTVMFRAHVIKDTKGASASATGHALSTEVKGSKEKIFEKVETIAVGRALALLGYGADGEIASSEEMEEFEAHKIEKFQAEVEEYKERLGKCKTLEQLKDGWGILPVEVKKELETLKVELKEKLTPKKDEKVKVSG